MKKVIIIVVLVLLVLIVVAGVFFWYAMGKVLYEPGMVRAGENLRAPLTHHWNKESLVDGWSGPCTSVWGHGMTTATP